MSRISILDPTASPALVDTDPGPPIQSAHLAHGQIGIRYDLTWKSFDWVRAEWDTLFSEGGASVSSWCAGDRTGEAAEATLKALQGFARDQDIVISGLGN